MKVKWDMGEYEALKSGKSPYKGAKNKQDEEYKNEIAKVKQYVEDLVVMREALLKIEFRNIELEEASSKKEREVDELKQEIRELESMVKSKQGKDQKYEYQEESRQIIDLQQRLMEEKWNALRNQHYMDQMQKRHQELVLIQDKHIQEVREHHQLNATVLNLQAQIKELKGPQSIDERIGDMNHYDIQKERFLMFLGLFLDDLRNKNRLIIEKEHEEKLVRDLIIRKEIQIEGFQIEREKQKLLIDRIIAQKVSQVDDEFVSSAAMDEGLTKLEVHIMNQRKKIVKLKGQVESITTDNEILQQQQMATGDIVRNLERHSMEYNQELAQSKDEVVRLKIERERYEMRIQFMWDRLDFQQKLHHKVKNTNPTVEQVIKVYKDEILKLKQFLSASQFQNPKNKPVNQEKNKEKDIELSKSYILEIQNELNKLKNKENKQADQIARLDKENSELKLYIHMSDLIRKAVGLSQSEREEAKLILQKKKEKYKDLEVKYYHQMNDQDHLKEQISSLKAELQDIKVNGPALNLEYAKAQAQEKEESYQELKSQVKMLEIQNFNLKQQITEHKGEIENLNSEKEFLIQNQVQLADKKIRAVSPGRIKENPIKQQNNSKIDYNDVYYGQHSTVDPITQLNLEEERRSQRTKFPQIGNQNYSQQDIQPLNTNQQNKDKRHMTPMQMRLKQSYSSLTNDGLNKPPIIEKKRMNQKLMQSGLNSVNGNKIMNQSQNANNVTETPNDGHSFKVFSNQGPSLTHQGSTHSNNNSFLFKNTQS